MRGDWHSGPVVPFRTGIIDGDLAPFRVTTPRNTSLRVAEPLLLYSIELPVQRAMATDLEGNVVWYLPLHERSLTRMVPGGRFLTLTGGVTEQS